MPRSLWQPALRAPVARLQIKLPLVHCGLSQSLDGLGHTLLWTLLRFVTAFTTAELLVEHVFRLHGIPIDIVSDRGPQFISQVWKAFCKALGATASLSSGYHPQTNGQSERANQILGTSLRCMVEKEPDSWSTLLPWIEYAHNSLPSSSTGRSPSLGYQPPLFPSHEQDISEDLDRD